MTNEIRGELLKNVKGTNVFPKPIRSSVKANDEIAPMTVIHTLDIAELALLRLI